MLESIGGGDWGRGGCTLMTPAEDWFVAVRCVSVWRERESVWVGNGTDSFRSSWLYSMIAVHSLLTRWHHR